MEEGRAAERGGSSGEEKATGRVEAFSDGIFAFAITLLALDLRDPTIPAGSTLVEGLVGEWPTFFAFVTSFVTVLIMWVNHHNMFKAIQRIDKQLMFLNGLLLLFVVLTPFTTSLVAAHMLTAEAGTAAAVYSGMFLLLSIVWNVFWRYASRHELMVRGYTGAHVQVVARQYLVGPTAYASAFVVSFISGLASVIVVLLVAGFFAVTATIAR